MWRFRRHVGGQVSPKGLKSFPNISKGDWTMDMFKKIKPLTKRLKVFLNIPGHPGQCLKNNAKPVTKRSKVFLNMSGDPCKCLKEL
jgi:hypothetical protein